MCINQMVHTMSLGLSLALRKNLPVLHLIYSSLKCGMHHCILPCVGDELHFQTIIANNSWQKSLFSVLCGGQVGTSKAPEGRTWEFASPKTPAFLGVLEVIYHGYADYYKPCADSWFSHCDLRCLILVCQIHHRYAQRGSEKTARGLQSDHKQHYRSTEQ